MAEVKKINTSKTTKTSKVQGNSSKKKQVSIPNAKYESCYVLASDVYEKEVRKFLEA